MKRFLSLMLFGLMLLTLACSKTEELLIQLDEEFTLSFQATQRLITTEIDFRFEEILEDSRCPSSSIQCAWEGWVRVIITISEGEKETTVELIEIGDNTNEGELTATYDQYQIKLIEVTPYPISNNSRIPFEDYQVILKITEL